MTDFDERQHNVWAPTEHLIRGTKRPGLFVILCGLGTSALTLALLSVIGVNPMGYYVNLIPIGALLVGLMAGSGYGLASWLTGAKMGRGLLVIVVVLQVAAYIAAQYIEFVQLQAKGAIPDGVDFASYFDFITRSFTFQDSRHNNKAPAEPWGAWGYLLRLAEIAGFAAGGAIGPAFLFNVPYCDDCQIYKSTAMLGHFAAGVRMQKIGKRKKDAMERYQNSHASALDLGLQRGEQVVAQVKAGDINGLSESIRSHNIKSKNALELTSHLALKLAHCQRCHTGDVILLLVVGNNQGKAQELCRVPVNAEFIASALKISAKG